MPPDRPPAQRRRRRPGWRTLLAASALGLALVVPPQLLGGIDSWAIGTTALLALVALASAHHATHGHYAVPYRHPLLLVMLALLAWTAVQALPMPCGLAELLAPEAAVQVARNRALLGDASAGACTISWAPGATHWEIAKGITIVSVFTAAWILSATGHRRKVLIAAGASALAMAVVGLAHEAVDAEKVFGVYAPRYGMHRPVLAPLLNPNQLAGFLAMGVPVLAALGMATRDLAVRVSWMAGAALCGATAVATLSRGGMAGLVAGLCVLGILLAIRQRGRRAVARFGWLGALLGTTVALAAYLALEPVTQELTEGDMSKLELIGNAGQFVLEHPWAGVGRGAFAAAFVQGGHMAEYRAEYPESFAVQWAAEWGIPAALVLVVVLAVSLGRATAAARSPERAGAVAAVASIGVHDLVDFSLELAGVVVVAAALLAASVAPRRSRSASRATDVRLRQTPAPLIAGGVVLLALLTPSLVGGSVRNLQDDLVDAMRAGDGDHFRTRLVGALALHPSEPVFPLLAATEAVRTGDPKALAWLNRSMELAPAWASPHVLAARWLWNKGAEEQSMLEVREAAARSPIAPQRFVCRKLRRHPRAADLLSRAAPKGPMRAPFLEVATACVSPDSDTAAALDAMLLEAAPSALQPRLRAALRQARGGEANEAVEELASLAERFPTERRVWLALAQAQLEGGWLREALAALDRAEELPGDLREVLRVRARAQAAREEFDSMRDTLQRLRGLSGSSAAQVARTLTLEAELWEETGRPAQAVAAYKRAYNVDPRRERLEKVAQAAEAMGDRVGAFRTYLELCQRFPDVARYCESRDRLRKAMSDGLGLEPSGQQNPE